MPLAAVIIPTIAAKRTKQKLSREQEIRLWGKMVRNVISNSLISVQKSGFEPSVVLVNNESKNTAQVQAAIEREISRMPATFKPRVHLIQRPGSGWMGSVIEGSRFAVDRLNAAAVCSMADDFEIEAKKIGRLLEPLRRKDPSKRADIAFLQWGKFERSFEPIQFIQKRFEHMLINVANPRFKAKPNESFLVAANRSGREVQDIPSYGVMAMDAKTFNQSYEFVQRHYPQGTGGHADLASVMLLSALRNPAAKVEGIDFPRRFEHFIPRNRAEQQKLVNLRAKWFSEKTDAIEQFLKATGQNEKIGLLADARKVFEEVTRDVPRTWKPGVKKIGKIARRAYRRQEAKRK